MVIIAMERISKLLNPGWVGRVRVVFTIVNQTSANGKSIDYSGTDIFGHYFSLLEDYYWFFQKRIW